MAGTWYRTGTVAVAAGSKTITGSGTEFTKYVSEGFIFLAGGQICEVDTVDSDLQLTLVEDFGGASASGVKFACAPTQATIPPLTRRVTQLLGDVGPVKDAYDAGDIASTVELEERAKKSDLAAEATLDVFAFTAAEAQSIFDTTLPKGNYAAIRNDTSRAKAYRVLSDGIYGDWEVDTTDSTSADDNATVVIRAGDGARVKRRFDGQVQAAWFGVIANNPSVDNYSAIRAAVQCAINNRSSATSVPSVLLPPGEITVKQSGLFSGFATPVQGLNIFGHGMKSTTILLESSVLDVWFYETGVLGKQFVGDLKFEDLSVVGVGPKSHLVSLNSNGTDKRPRFVNVTTSNLGTILKTQGSGNADLSSFFNCQIGCNDTVLDLNNPQSVVHNFVNTNIHTLGDIVRVGALGGGDVTFDGGNIEIWPSSGKGYAVRKTGPGVSGQGLGNCNFTFNKVRFELADSGDGGCLVYTPNGFIGPFVVNFRDCGIGNIRGANDRDIVDIASPGTTVKITGGTLARLFKATVSADTSGAGVGAALPAHLIVDGVVYDGLAPSGMLNAKCNVVGNLARVTLKNVASGIVSGGASVYSADIDKGYPTYSWAEPAASRTTVKLLRPSVAWPRAGLEILFSLPPNINVTRLFIEKPAIALTDSYQLFVGSKDKSVIVGQSALSTLNSTHIIDVKDYGRVAFAEWAIWAVTTAANAFSFNAAGKLPYIEYI